MSASVDYVTCTAAFHQDGSVRDLYVLSATQADWQRFLRFAEAQGAFWDGDTAAPVPDDLACLFEGDGLKLFQFQRGPIDIQCIPFTEEEIELFLGPEQVADQAAFDALTAFMRDLGMALGKPVLLTEENARECIWLKFSSENETFAWLH